MGEGLSKYLFSSREEVLFINGIRLLNISSVEKYFLKSLFPSEVVGIDLSIRVLQSLIHVCHQI